MVRFWLVPAVVLGAGLLGPGLTPPARSADPTPAASARPVVRAWLDGGVDPPSLPPAPRPSEPDDGGGRAPAPGPFRTPAAPLPSPPPPAPAPLLWQGVDATGQWWYSADRAAVERQIAAVNASRALIVPPPVAVGGPVRSARVCGPAGCR